MDIYREKPQRLYEAMQWTGDNLKELLEWVGKHPDWDKWFQSFEEYETYVKNNNNIFKLIRNNYVQYCNVGDYILKDCGNFFCWYKEEFENTYEKHT